jgi:hypothetical protein
MADVISWCVASNCEELPVAWEFDVFCFTFVFWRENECSYTIFRMAQHPLLCWVLLIIEASWSPSDTPHWVELLWTSDQPDAETSTWQHKTLTIDISTPLVEFEPMISESERLQSHTLDRTDTGISLYQWFQNCVPRSKGIRDPFLRDSWIHFCNGYFDIYLSLIKGIMFC